MREAPAARGEDAGDDAAVSRAQVGRRRFRHGEGRAGRRAGPRTDARRAKRAGTALADTGVRGQGFGLSTGGGSTGGGSYLDVANFCCPEYIQTMSDRFHQNWQPQPNFAGEALVKFTIQRDGKITGVELEKSSGSRGPT